MTAIYQPNKNGDLTRHHATADASESLCGLVAGRDWTGALPFGSKKEPRVWTCGPCRAHPDAMASSRDSPPPDETAEPFATVAAPATRRTRKAPRMGLFDAQMAML